MGYSSLAECVADLERTGQLLRLETEVDPNLEAAEIQRRVYRAGGPAILFTRAKGCAFPLLSNLFGTLERTRFIFRDTLKTVETLVRMKVDPTELLRSPAALLRLPFVLPKLLPKFTRRGPILANEITVDRLPPMRSWPMDGGPFVTLPQVYTEDPERPGWRHSNLGMYRVQLSGNQYATNRQIGLHYQIHRGIGVHHAAALAKGEPLRVTIAVGGPPVMTLAAVMPLPEGMPELVFAGALGGRRVRLIRRGDNAPVFADADFCICGTIDPKRQLPEGPFGDHLGYYSLVHDFPVLNVERVFHRDNAIWPFTVVGRPPQEDTSFGKIIHEITGPVIPSVLPGVKQVHAVDAAGVHPLLLAIASERYVPYETLRKPRELLTAANAILGQGQLSLAKFLFIVAKEDHPSLDAENIRAYLQHMLERVDWRTDLHFQTCTTIDTLDYTGSALNEGSKVVIAAAGSRRRELPKQLPPEIQLPDGFHRPKLVLPGIIAISAPVYPQSRPRPPGFSSDNSADAARSDLRRFCEDLPRDSGLSNFPMLVLVDDSEFAAASLDNFLWTTFTSANPAADIDGINATTFNKHWGCSGPLVIDARLKPWQAPPLVEDPAVTRRVDQLAAPGGPLHGICP